MKKLLVVIDMQNDFVFGALGSKEAAAIVPIVKEEIEKAKSAGMTVVFTRDTHGGGTILPRKREKIYPFRIA